MECSRPIILSANNLLTVIKLPRSSLGATTTTNLMSKQVFQSSSSYKQICQTEGLVAASPTLTRQQIQKKVPECCPRAQRKKGITWHHPAFPDPADLAGAGPQHRAGRGQAGAGQPLTATLSDAVPLQSGQAGKRHGSATQRGANSK